MGHSQSRIARTPVIVKAFEFARSLWHTELIPKEQTVTDSELQWKTKMLVLLPSHLICITHTQLKLHWASTLTNLQSFWENFPYKREKLMTLYSCRGIFSTWDSWLEYIYNKRNERRNWNLFAVCVRNLNHTVQIDLGINSFFTTESCQGTLW